MADVEESTGFLQDPCLRNVGTYYLLTGAGVERDDAFAMINNNDVEKIMHILDTKIMTAQLYLDMWKNNKRD